jgi:hypothetical protein
MATIRVFAASLFTGAALCLGAAEAACGGSTINPQSPTSQADEAPPETRIRSSSAEVPSSSDAPASSDETSAPREPPASGDAPANAAPSGEAPSLPAWSPGANMSEAIASVVDNARSISERYQILGFDARGPCVLGAFLLPGKGAHLLRNFEGGATYVFIGGGSTDAVDIDLAIQDTAGRKVLAHDNSNDATPVVVFVPPSSGNYMINAILQKKQRHGAFVALAVLRVGGYPVPIDRFIDSFGKVLIFAQGMSARYPSLRFHDATNDWAFYSIFLDQGQRWQLAGIRPESRTMVMLSAADSFAQDVDIGVLDARTSTVVAKDTDRDATPAAVFQPASPGPYDVVIENEQSRGPSLVTTLVLEASE